MSEKKLSNFITEIIDADLAADTHGGRVITRFPPEPNGYLHIGHAKAICVNFGLAAQYGGDCHLRFDDTNPTTEDTEYVESIMNDVRWLGFEWTGEVRFASDYFEQMASWAEELIAQGLAYVDFSSIEELRSMRGAVGEPGTPSRYRNTSPEENAEHFRKMRAGEYPDGHCVLRAKIDLSAANILMRDPLLYRIRKEHHHRTGDAWCIYPMYDFAHCLEDAIEGVTHSICTLEFQNNRELYDWVIEHVTLPTYRPRQYEMARLALPNTVMSKRRLIALVQEGHVWGWDDPRMPTLAGIRRRGVPPEAIRQFCDMIGVAKANSTVDWDKFDFALRDTLNTRAERVMAVLDPIKLTLTNVDEAVAIEAELWPHDVPGDATRRLNLGSELLIERSDFAEVPPKGWRRLSPGGEVRLRRGWVVRCDEVIKDADGVVTELRATADLATLGAAPVGRKVRGTIHWLNAADAVPATVRLIEPLFDAPSPGSQPEVDYRDELNSNSLQVLEGAYVEPYAAAAALGSRFQFERCGYFTATRTMRVWCSTGSLVCGTAGVRPSRRLSRRRPSRSERRSRRRALAERPRSRRRCRLRSTRSLRAMCGPPMRSGSAEIARFVSSGRRASPQARRRKTPPSGCSTTCGRCARAMTARSVSAGPRSLASLRWSAPGGSAVRTMAPS